jgi:uncharacterized membrane protein YphA (DoxX/SURF4 family)
MTERINRVAEYSTVYLRLALGIGFLSSVADRFGLWGGPGAKNVAWGNFKSFLTFTAVLNPFLPGSWIPVVGWIVTVAEFSLGVSLIVGFRIKEAALVAGALLMLFATAMTLALGIKVPFDYSVLAASGGAFLLAAYGKSVLSVDELISRKEPTTD